MSGLLDLCLGKAGCGLTMQRIRSLYHLRMSTINPLTDLIDKCIGVQWYATPNFWNGGVDDAYTLHADPPEAFFQLCIYGELFGPAIHDYLRTGTVPAYALPESRAEFVKYCIPDWCARWAARNERNLRDGEGNPTNFCVVDVTRTPYSEPLGPESHDNMISLKHLLGSTRWNRAWTALSVQLHERAGTGELVTQDEIDEQEEREWEEARGGQGHVAGVEESTRKGDEAGLMSTAYGMALWRACVVFSGYQGLTALARCGLGEYGKEVGDVDDDFVDRMSELWKLLMSAEGPRLQEEYMVIGGGMQTAMWPDLLGDLTILTNGYYG